MPLSLSERQSRTVGIAVTIIAAVIILVAIGCLVWLIGWFLQRFSGVFAPLAVGAVAALVFRPYYDWFRDRGFPSSIAVVTVFVSVLLPLGGFLWFFGSLLLEQIIDMAGKLPAWTRSALTEAKLRWPAVVDFMQNNPYGQALIEAMEGQQQAVVQGLRGLSGRAVEAGAGVLKGVGTLFAWAVLPVYFAFFLTAKPKQIDLAELLPFLKSSTRDDVVYLIHEFVDIIVAFFRGQIIVAFLQGLLFAIGFSLAGLRYGFVIGLALGFLNVIPYLGSILGLSVALPLALFQPNGGMATMVTVMVVFVVVQLIEGYVLTPKIMGDRTGLHFMAIIVAVFFWGSALGGILGMILAIPLTAFLVSFWRLANEKYIHELV